jgi:hypothetical protein
MSDPSGAEALVHEKLRAAAVDGAAVLDSVVSLMTARAALEASYSKSLAKLAAQSFSFSEKTIHPAVFEAVASLRGDIANEGVQHLELANSIQKEVIEPLSRLNDRNDKVQRIVSSAAWFPTCCCSPFLLPRALGSVFRAPKQRG